MREILFRGKGADNGKWVYGYYELYNGGHYINVQTDRVNSGGYPIREFIEVIPETVGQYTGLTNKNGKKIFEGDICYSENESVYEIVWIENMHGFYCKVLKSKCVLIPNQTLFPIWQYDERVQDDCHKLEIIGNIHDNPELLKEGAE